MPGFRNTSACGVFRHYARAQPYALGRPGTKKGGRRGSVPGALTAKIIFLKIFGLATGMFVRVNIPYAAFELAGRGSAEAGDSENEPEISAVPNPEG